jgi:hypothetical protein
MPQTPLRAGGTNHWQLYSARGGGIAPPGRAITQLSFRDLLLLVLLPGSPRPIWNIAKDERRATAGSAPEPPGRHAGPNPAETRRSRIMANPCDSKRLSVGLTIRAPEKSHVFFFAAPGLDSLHGGKSPGRSAKPPVNCIVMKGNSERDWATRLAAFAAGCGAHDRTVTIGLKLMLTLAPDEKGPGESPGPDQIKSPKAQASEPTRCARRDTLRDAVLR